jgi:hypothetical protein
MDIATSERTSVLVTGGNKGLGFAVRYAQALPEIKFNIATPGEVANRKFAATDMNHHTGELTVTEGTDSIVKLAMIDADGPTGTFIDRLGPVAW